MVPKVPIGWPIGWHLRDRSKFMTRGVEYLKGQYSRLVWRRSLSKLDWGLGILLAESRKSLKKVMENRKSQKSSAENRKKHLCQKPENAIFKPRKSGKIGKYGGNQKTQFQICGNRKSSLGSCGKPEKPKKTMEIRGNRKIRKKATESWKKYIFSAESRKQTPYSQPSL